MTLLSQEHDDALRQLISRTNGANYVDDADLTPTERAVVSQFLQPAVGFNGAVVWPINELSGGD